MRFIQWAYGDRTGPPRRGVLLHLTACEDRLVPDGGLPAPPAGWGPPGPTSVPDQAYTATVQPGEWLYAGQVGGLDQRFTLDTHGRQWLFSVDPNGGAFTAVLLNYDGSYDPTEHPLTQADFLPAADKWNLVWDPDQGTWSTIPPGTVFPSEVTGFTSGDWNYVHLKQQQAPRPANPPAQPAGGVTVTIAPGGIVTITTPTGTVSIAPLPDGGAVIVVTTPGSPPVISVIGGASNPPILWAGSGDSPGYFGATDIPLGVGGPVKP